MRRGLTGAAVLGTLAILASVAVGYFVATGAGTATASVTTLSVPGSPSATSGNNVTVTWTASTIGGSVAATSYTVERFSSTGTDLGAATCSPVPSTAGTPNAFGSFSCTDSPGAGTFKYTITAHFDSSWSAATGFTTTATAKNITTTTASGPASGTTGTAIAAASISATLAGATSGAGGTITFTVFGPQASAPATCTSGGTQIGTTVTVSGNNTYHPTTTYTPTLAGTYWWYASYSGDANNAASNSTCGSGMSSTTIKNTTTTTASGPATGVAGTAIAASSISSTLAGATSGAGGTITFTVFGPQASAPATCTSGGTQIGTAVTVSGNATYHPTTSYTPSSPGTYWWYASYSGDANNAASNSTCGSGMSSTTIKNATTTTASAPATDTAGTAIASGNISATLAGATSTAGGTITFKVFGPQSTAPSTCTSGGTQIGTTVTVSGNNTYHPTTSYTPSTPGTYWWYASYSGDSGNGASNSTCGSGMASTVAWTFTQAASVTDILNAGKSVTTSSFAVQPSTTYLLLIFRNSQGTNDAVSSISSSGLSPALTTASFTAIKSGNYGGGSYYQAAYWVSTASSASGSGTLTVTFNNSKLAAQATIVDLVQVQGNSLTSPVANSAIATSTSTTATANVITAPASGDASVAFLNATASLGGSPPTASPTMTNVFNSQPIGGTAATYTAVPGQQNESFSLGVLSQTWGTIAIELAHG